MPISTPISNYFNIKEFGTMEKEAPLNTLTMAIIERSLHLYASQFFNTQYIILETGRLNLPTNDNLSDDRLKELAHFICDNSKGSDIAYHLDDILGDDVFRDDVFERNKEANWVILKLPISKFNTLSIRLRADGSFEI